MSDCNSVECSSAECNSIEFDECNSIEWKSIEETYCWRNKDVILERAKDYIKVIKKIKASSKR